MSTRNIALTIIIGLALAGGAFALYVAHVFHSIGPGF